MHRMTTSVLLLALTLSAARVGPAWSGSAAEPTCVVAPPAETVEQRRGRILFLQCSACHAIDSTEHAKVGPHLARLYGRRAGSLESFPYSPALAAVGLIWDEQTLDRWLEAPQSVVPGNVMAFPGIDRAEDRKALLAYLAVVTSAGCAIDPADATPGK